MISSATGRSSPIIFETATIIAGTDCARDHEYLKQSHGTAGDAFDIVVPQEKESNAVRVHRGWPPKTRARPEDSFASR